MIKKVFLAALLAATGTVASANVTTNIYTTFSGTASGAPYSGFAGSVSTPGVTFATDFAYNWHPFGLGTFGSDTVGTLTAAAAGAYTFFLNSDDGSQAFIDGALVVDDGGAHGPALVSNTVTLTAGVHTFEVQFYECCGGASGVDFGTPTGITLGVPEPATWALMIIGMGGIGVAMRRRTALNVA